MPDLAGWHDWGLPVTRAPHVVRELSGGRTNRTFLIEADTKRWVLRMNARNDADPGIDREREIEVHTAAANAGIAPPIAYASPGKGILITEYVDGVHWTAADLRDSTKVPRLCALMQHVHRLQVNTAVLDYYVHCERYWRQLEAAAVDIPTELNQQREAIRVADHRPTLEDAYLCHHDFTPHNVVECDGRLTLLDWEYAARGAVAFDYAALSVAWSLPLDVVLALVDVRPEELAYAIALYRLTCRLWSLLHDDSKHRLGLQPSSQ